MGWLSHSIKAEMGIGTLIVFLGVLLTAATAAGVFLQTAGSFQEKAISTGKQTQGHISTGLQPIEVIAENGLDSTIEQFATIYKLAPGSDPIQLQTLMLAEATQETSSALKLRKGGEAINDVFTGYYAATSYPQEIKTTPFEQGVPNDFFARFGTTQTSEFLIGKIAVAIILVESDGSIDANTEDWSAQEEEEAIGYAQEALNWFKALEPQANIKHTFTIYRSVPTSYEPISRNAADENQHQLWINETLDNIGVAPAADTFTRIRAFNDQLRRDNNAHWAFTLFVVDASNTPGGGFPDGLGGLAYINGPYAFVSNSAYAPNQAAVFAHEFAHVFGARDQYSGCSCTDTGGYYNLQTQNCVATGCQTNTTSLMKTGSTMLQAYNEGKLDVFALGQLGLIDVDENGLLDPLDHLFEATANGISDATLASLAGTYSTSRANTGFYTYEYLQRGINPDQDTLKQGDVIRIYQEAGKPLYEAEEVYFKILPKTGSPLTIAFETPNVINTRQLRVYPSR